MPINNRYMSRVYFYFQLTNMFICTTNRPKIDCYIRPVPYLNANQRQLVCWYTTYYDCKVGGECAQQTCIIVNHPLSLPADDLCRADILVPVRRSQWFL